MHGHRFIPFPTLTVTVASTFRLPTPPSAHVVPVSVSWRFAASWFDLLPTAPESLTLRHSRRESLNSQLAAAAAAAAILSVTRPRPAPASSV